MVDEEKETVTQREKACGVTDLEKAAANADLGRRRRLPPKALGAWERLGEEPKRLKA